MKSLLNERDFEGFTGGRDARAFGKLGAHLAEIDGAAGTYFAVWAPEAHRVEVIEPEELREPRLDESPLVRIGHDVVDGCP